MAEQRVRVWDLPTRIFHLFLILGVAGSLITVYASDELMVWLGRCGLFLLGLLLWRLVWGCVGGHWSRFVHFVEHPKAAWQTLQHHRAGQHTPSLGHNPLGGWSVIIMLCALLLQAASGLCSDDEVAFSGPLSAYLSADGVEWVTWYHSEVGQPLIWSLIGLHVAVIFYHRWRLHDDLITPMISGDKIWPVPEHPDGTAAPKTLMVSEDTWARRVAALVLWCALNAACFYGLPL